MKAKDRILAIVLTWCICLGTLVMPAAAATEQKAIYAQFSEILEQKMAMAQDDLLAGELVDPDADGIPELILVYAPDDDEFVAPYLIEVYRYDAGKAEPVCVYQERDGWSNWIEAEISLGTMQGTSAIGIAYCEQTGSTEIEGCRYICFDTDCTPDRQAVTFIRQYDPDNKLAEPFCTYYNNVTDEEISESQYHAIADGYQMTRMLANCPNVDRFSAAEDFDLTAFAAELKQEMTAAQETPSDNIVQLTETERAALMDFMRLFNDWEYDGTIESPSELVMPLFNALIYSWNNQCTYFAEKYDYLSTDDGISIQTAELANIMEDALGIELPSENVESGTYTLTFADGTATICDTSGELILSTVYFYHDLVALYQLADDLYYGVFKLQEAFVEEEDSLGLPQGHAVLQAIERDGKTYWRCHYASQSGEPLDEETLDSYCALLEEKPEPEPENMIEEAENTAVEEETAQEGFSWIIVLSAVVLICVIAGVIWIKRKAKTHL